jgi:ApbE superfamily uncharacterized protein (UPF0280 family)
MFNKRLELEETQLDIISDIRPDFVENFVISKRVELKKYIFDHYSFFNSHGPVDVLDVDDSEGIVKIMADAAKIANVGPMAAVAGTFSQLVLEELIKKGSKYSVVNNGGDIAFINVDKKMICGIYAGNSSISGELAFEFTPQTKPLGLCTSSGSVGDSFRYGRADCVSVIAEKASVADTIATAIANDVSAKEDPIAVENGLDTAEELKEHFIGALIIVGDSIGTIGKLPDIVTLEKDSFLDLKEDTIV